MKSLLLAMVAAWASPALADSVVPHYLGGVWATADSLFAGTTEQAELYLREDGFGLLIGSSAPATITSGPDKGKPGPRATLGMPFRSRLEGATLTIAPFNPGYRQDRGPMLICHYQEPDATLHCTADKKSWIMRRRSDTLDTTTAEMIEGFQIALRAYAGKASALLPAPSIRP
ncbi:hypothetical protein LK542_21095 [Massilia sp. IC2-477]|uniref:hypothetical protein n=1 Tax=Massilia sp. IC2-477 TaxID=2887198 RepID=UPI001D113E2F|nr:hypothetical protein [Massilia sp. IC2-477]MCC2958124.1 hypothetical protein [Massilia sp. IC2-477]